MVNGIRSNGEEGYHHGILVWQRRCKLVEIPLLRIMVRISQRTTFSFSVFLCLTTIVCFIHDDDDAWRGVCLRLLGLDRKVIVVLVVTYREPGAQGVHHFCNKDYMFCTRLENDSLYGRRIFLVSPCYCSYDRMDLAYRYLHDPSRRWSLL